MFILLFNYIYNERKHDFKLNVSTYVCLWTFCNYNDKHAWWSIMNNCLDGPSSDMRHRFVDCVFLRELPVSLKNKYWYKWHTYLSTWIYFYFYITVSLKKIKQYRLQRPVLNWITESNKKSTRLCCMGVDKSERKILFLLPQNIKTVHVSHFSIFLYQEFFEK